MWLVVGKLISTVAKKKEWRVSYAAKSPHRLFINRTDYKKRFFRSLPKCDTQTKLPKHLPTRRYPHESTDTYKIHSHIKYWYNSRKFLLKFRKGRPMRCDGCPRNSYKIHNQVLEGNWSEYSLGSAWPCVLFILSNKFHVVCLFGTEYLLCDYVKARLLFIFTVNKYSYS